MTLFRLGGSGDAHLDPEGGSPENPAVPLTAGKLLEWFGLGGPSSSAGVTVTPPTALRMSAVYRAVALVSFVAGELPLRPFRVGSYEPVRSKLLEDPHPEYPPGELWRMLVVHRAMYGNSFAQKLYNQAGQVRELWPIHPGRVQAGRVPSASDNPSGKVFDVVDDWGVSHALTSHEIFHVPHLSHDGLVGLSPIAAARQAVGMGLAAEEYAAKLFGSGNLLSGFVSTEATLNEDQAKLIQRRWRERMLGRHHQHDVAVLDAGAKFQQLTMPSKDAQFLESRQFQVPEIGRMFGVPPFLLYSTEKSTSWGTGLEQQSLGFSIYDLGPQWLTPLEQRISKELLKRPYEARFHRSRLLRGDSAARAAYASQMRQWGGFSANEVRALEEMPPVEGGDSRIQPLNMGPLGEAAADEDADAAQDPPEPVVPEPDEDEEEDDDDAEQ